MQVKFVGLHLFAWVFLYLPRPYKLPRKKGKPIIVSAARSIDGSYSEATSIKFDTPVSGGAYQKLVRCLSCGTTTKTLVLT